MCIRDRSIHVDASVVVGDVDLAAIDDGRVEFVEEELNIPLLRVPEDGDGLGAVGVGDEVVGVVDEEASVGDGGVGVAVGNGAEEERGAGGGTVAGQGTEAAEMCIRDRA